MFKEFPPYIDLPHGRVWFTIDTMNVGWQVAYISEDGEAVPWLHCWAASLPQALQMMKENLVLVKMTHPLQSEPS